MLSSYDTLGDMKPEPDVLRGLYVDDRKTLKEIAVPLGVSPALVRKWLLAAGISTRSVAEARRIAKKPIYSETTLARMRERAANARAAKTDTSYKKQSATRRRKKIKPYNAGQSWTTDERAAHMAVRRTEEYRERLSASVSGAKNANWRGGVASRAPRGWRWNEIRKVVYERDNWTCQDCKTKCLNTADSKSQPKRKIQCHHVIRRRDGGLDVPENLVTLCMSCHHKRERAADAALFA